jgi:hypothetical protein
MALQVDALAESEIGQDRNEAPVDEEERLRDAIFKAKLIDRGWTRISSDD